MLAVKNTLSRLPSLKKMVKEKDPKHFSHTSIENHPITPETISIVMTSHNRSKQVYYTLTTISRSIHKSIQVIIVDDSDIDPIDVEILKTYLFYIDFIQIDRSNKNWENPCINYNIGFEFIKGNVLIIQNGEVCHVGDVLHKLNEKGIEDNQYYVFDVAATRNFDVNEKLYEIDDLSTNIYTQPWWQAWYQHHTHGNRSLHFLVALTTETFKRVKGFSYDYAFLSWYDDDDFLFKIGTLGIQIVLIPNETEKVGGIHLFHVVASNTSAVVPHAYQLFQKKIHYHRIHHLYLEISEGKNLEDLTHRFECLNQCLLLA